MCHKSSVHSCSDAALEALDGSTHVLSCIPPLGLPLYDPVRGELLVRDIIGCWQLLILTMLLHNIGTVMGGWSL